MPCSERPAVGACGTVYLCTYLRALSDHVFARWFALLGKVCILRSYKNLALLAQRVKITLQVRASQLRYYLLSLDETITK